MAINSFYTIQSKITDPGCYAYLYDDLPNDVTELCTIIQGLIMHFADEDLLQYKIPEERYVEMDDRYVEKILQRITAKNPSPLTAYRAVEQRTLGICRDMSALLCSILRYKKIPARLRTGFVNYFLPGFNLDIVCVEYWNHQRNKWCLVDSRTNYLHINKYRLNLDFDLHDLTLDQFIPAETAWQACRSTEKQSNRFGSRQHRGLWYVRNRLIHELALINKYEMLMWDMWGFMLSQKNGMPHLAEEQYPLLDSLADLIRSKQSNLIPLNDYYWKHNELTVPDAVVVLNPFTKRRFDHVNVK